MKSQTRLVKKIHQKDNYTFTIQWNDGVIADYRLSELQKHCPCANCVDEISGNRLLDVNAIKPNVRAISLMSVGRYALKVQFSSGCSTGIYDFDMLYNLSKERR